MKTVEEKAREASNNYGIDDMTALEQHRLAWPDKSDEWLFERLDGELKSKVNTIHNLLDQNEKLNEAMRWRDFDKELPAEGQRILRKIEAINESETLWAQNPYYTDVYRGAYSNFDSEEYKKARERFRYLWRPIE